MANKTQPPAEMQMQPAEFAELRRAVADLKERDIHLGRALEQIVLHLGHAHGLDPAQEDAKAREEEAHARAEAEKAASEQTEQPAQESQ